jgi:DNA gyrase inhibitor GyrI
MLLNGDVKMKIAVVISAILLVLIAVFVLKFSRFGVETPEYNVIEKDGAFEIRDYPSMMIVSTSMENPNFEDGTSFMRLFRYISGENESEQKIAMTTPVITSKEEGTQQMSFIVPREIAQNGVPKARSEQVEVDTLEAGRFAVYRFSGDWDVNRFEEAKVKLETWLAERKLSPTSEAMIASYDPPMTPSFLKRNEILVKL